MAGVPAPHAADAVHTAPQCDAALSRAFALLGKRWNGMILGTLATGPAGFAELRRGVQPISDSVLSDRMAELVGAGLVERTVEDGPPVTVRYGLTPAGTALLPSLEALAGWAREHLPPG